MQVLRTGWSFGEMVHGGVLLVSHYSRLYHLHIKRPFVSLPSSSCVHEDPSYDFYQFSITLSTYSYFLLLLTTMLYLNCLPIPDSLTVRNNYKTLQEVCFCSIQLAVMYCLSCGLSMVKFISVIQKLRTWAKMKKREDSKI